MGFPISTSNQAIIIRHKPLPGIVTLHHAAVNYSLSHPVRVELPYPELLLSQMAGKTDRAQAILTPKNKPVMKP